jgi:hypothetical protein
VRTRWTLRGKLAGKLRPSDGDEEVTVSGTSVSRVIGGNIQETRLRCEADLQEPQRPVPGTNSESGCSRTSPPQKRRGPIPSCRP